MENLWEKLKNWFLKFLFHEDKSIKKLPEGSIQNTEKENAEYSKMNIIEEQANDSVYKKALNAFASYALNEDSYVGENIYNTIKERLEVNKDNIEKVLELKKYDITYNEILNMYNKAKEDLNDYKKTINMEKIDDFLLSSFYVPHGVIGIKTNNPLIIIENMFKTITTRNAIVIINDETDEYSIEKLLLIIVQEALKKFNIDENIIQIVGSKDAQNDINEFDLYINENGEKVEKEFKDKMYIYMEDNFFEEEVEKEQERLQGKSIEIIKNANINTAIKTINKNPCFGASIYSKDGRKAYKFINMINSKNVFFNGTLLNAKESEESKNNYYKVKNILCENILKKVS